MVRPRIPGPELPPDSAPSERRQPRRRFLPFPGRGGPRREQPGRRDSRSEIDDLRNQVTDLGGRVRDLESDRRRLQGQVRRLRSGRTEEPVQSQAPAQPETLVVPPPADMAAGLAMIRELNALKGREPQEPALAAQIDATYLALSQGTFTGGTPEQAKSAHEALWLLGQVEYQENIQRRQSLQTALERIWPFVPKNAAQLTAIMNSIPPLKQQELSQRGFTQELDLKLQRAYDTLASSPIDTRPAQAGKLLRQARELKSREFAGGGGSRNSLYVARQAALDRYIANLEARYAERGYFDWITG